MSRVALWLHNESGYRLRWVRYKFDGQPVETDHFWAIAPFRVRQLSNPAAAVIGPIYLRKTGEPLSERDSIVLGLPGATELDRVAVPSGSHVFFVDGLDVMLPRPAHEYWVGSPPDPVLFHAREGETVNIHVHFTAPGEPYRGSFRGYGVTAISIVAMPHNR